MYWLVKFCHTLHNQIVLKNLTNQIHSIYSTLHFSMSCSSINPSPELHTRCPVVPLSQKMFNFLSIAIIFYISKEPKNTIFIMHIHKFNGIFCSYRLNVMYIITIQERLVPFLGGRHRERKKMKTKKKTHTPNPSMNIISFRIEMSFK